MANRNEYRDALHNREVRRWKIVACLLGLLALYGLMGRMDHAAQVERMADEMSHPGFTQKLACKEPAACKVWI
jgi:hypothetical protein